MRLILLTAVFVVLAWPLCAGADPFVAATGDRIRLWAGRAPRATGESDAEVPDVTCFPPPPGTANGTAVVVCPGGGYSMLATGHEGVAVAKWLAEHGVYGFVLEYRVKTPQPAPMLDGQRAIRLLRYHAREWSIDPHRVGILGFSAGGHVASTVGTHYDNGIPHTGDPIQDQSCRPNFMVLAYAVVSMKADIAHPGSRHVLLGDDPSPRLVEQYSNETRVTTDTPPAFIVASRTDPVVPVENSERFADALRRHKVPVEFLELPTGGHGYGMAPGRPELAWTDRCLDWMRGQGLLSPPRTGEVTRRATAPDAGRSEATPG